MRRRNLILGLLVVAAMGTAHAQQSGKVYRIAIVHASAPATDLTEGSRSPIGLAKFLSHSVAWDISRGRIS
jgi:hypothetical protein